MHKVSRNFKILSIALMGAVAAVAASSGAAVAIPSKPKPAVDCTKKINKRKPACQTGNLGLTDDQLYNAAYWLARQGSYADALKLLREVKTTTDARVFNAIGYATRKLGDIDAALPYYAKALALDANYTKAREYLGEAHLALGDLAAAKVQLNEIESRCGKSCSGYAELAQEISAYIAQQSG
jgi:tetratricopeptide (TPR) repeat protein